MASTDCEGVEKPGSPWDYLLFAAAMAASLPFITANIVVFLHRKRRYFRAQGGALLILTSSTAGLIWIAASFVHHTHFPLKHYIFLVCPVWVFWLQLALGSWLWLACQPLRLLHLHYLCSSALTASAYSPKCRMVAWALLLWTPTLAFAIVATVKKASQLRYEGHSCAYCKLQFPWFWCTYVIMPSIYLAILVLLISAKRNKDSMVVFEYSRTSVFMVYLSYGVIALTGSQRKIAGRCFLTFGVCFVVFIDFWIRLGKPVYLCLWKGKSGMDSFEEELRSCGSECLDWLSSTTNTSRITRRLSSARNIGDRILRAIDAAMNDVSECEERINHLEQKKVALLAKINQLEVLTSAKYMSPSRSFKELT